MEIGEYEDRREYGERKEYGDRKENLERRDRRREDGEGRESQRRPRYFSREERKVNGFCLYWNKGSCHYEEFCRFLHEESPLCYFQEKCRRIESCRYFHEASSFLGQRSSAGQRR